MGWREGNVMRCHGTCHVMSCDDVMWHIDSTRYDRVTWYLSCHFPCMYDSYLTPWISIGVIACWVALIFVGTIYRTQLRMKYNLMGSSMEDCCKWDDTYVHVQWCGGMENMFVQCLSYVLARYPSSLCLWCWCYRSSHVVYMLCHFSRSSSCWSCYWTYSTFSICTI